MHLDELALDELNFSPCERYFWRSHSLSNRSGSDIFEALFQSSTTEMGMSGIATLLESPTESSDGLNTTDSDGRTPDKLARYSICAGSPRRVDGCFQVWSAGIGKILPLLKRLGEVPPPAVEYVGAERTDLEAQPPASLPFLGGWLGWLGYDLAWEIERLPWLKEDSLPFPVAFWYEPVAFALLDHQTQRLWIAADTLEGVEILSQKGMSQKGISQKVTSLDAPEANTPGVNQSIPSAKVQATVPPTLETSQTEFEMAVRRAKDHIRAGDVFQVNHSLRFQAQTTLSSWQVYRTLHRINPSPFASYWHTPWGAVVSCSPERLVQLDNRIAQSRPIAGTRPRGETVEADTRNERVLLSDHKEQAEHIMLVDLERNDLGRVCEWGSVQVDELMTIERYSHVMHLVSNVVGRLNSEASVAELIAALFPGGTITGCPKVRCMEIIESLEPVRRSLFYGSCGYLDRRGRLDLNILIRTLLMSPTKDRPTAADATSFVWGQVGAGIVADSDPKKEWCESLQKAKAQLLALGLPEDLIFSQSSQKKL